MNTVKELYARLKASRHFDKVQHFAAGMTVAFVYYLMVMGLIMYTVLTQSHIVYMYLLFTPHFLVGLITAAFVHASKEANDYLAKLRGENHEVSFLDFLAGMAGSFTVLYLLF